MTIPQVWDQFVILGKDLPDMAGILSVLLKTKTLELPADLEFVTLGGIENPL